MSGEELHPAGIGEIDVNERIVSISAASWEAIISAVNDYDIDNLRKASGDNIFESRQNDRVRILRDRLEENKGKVEKAGWEGRYFELGIAPFEHDLIVEALTGGTCRVDIFDPYINSAPTEEKKMTLGEFIERYNFADRFVKRGISQDERMNVYG